MLLQNDIELFKSLIIDCQNHFKINQCFIEKDFIVISALKSILSKNPNLIFKGGTSLSKCYKCINRFSEDIDISYNDEHLTVGQRRHLIEAIKESISENELVLTNLDSIRSKRYYNKFDCDYESITETSIVEKKVIIELATQTPSFPIEKKYVQTFIGEYLSAIGRNDLIEKYSLEPFEVNVQSIKRTLVDKTFALCDYYLSGRIEKHSRHIYDLYHIIPMINLDDDLLILFEQVRNIRQNIDVCLSAKDCVDYKKVFKELIINDAFKKDYTKTTYPLVYDSITYEECKKEITKLVEFLNKEN